MSASLGLLDGKLFASGWLVALFLNQGALLEELGWCGYVWPMFVRYFKTPLRAAIVVFLLAGSDLGWRRRRQLHGGDGSTDPSNAWAN